MQNDEIEFPTPICSDTAPHAKHRIAGTWRTECLGVEGDDSATKSYPRVDIAELDAKVVHDALPAHLVGDVSGSHYVKPERNKCVHGFWIQGDIETCPDGCTRTMADETEQWIADQVAQLSENELLLVKTVLDEIRAGRPAEHFMPGTKVYADSWGEAEFIVQGTAPWFDENGVPHRKVEVKSAAGGLSGHVHPSELRRVPPYSPVSACTCPLGPEDAHFPDCPWYVAR